ncbi:MAG: hypothetical protein AAB548_02920 [Patescibacteria group bacterium]
MSWRERLGHRWIDRYEPRQKSHWQKVGKELIFLFEKDAEVFLDDLWIKSPGDQYRALELVGMFSENEKVAGEVYGGLLVRYAKVGEGVWTEEEAGKAVEFLRSMTWSMNVKPESVFLGWQILLEVASKSEAFWEDREGLLAHIDYVTRRTLGRGRLEKDLPLMAEVLDSWRMKTRRRAIDGRGGSLVV